MPRAGSTAALAVAALGSAGALVFPPATHLELDVVSLLAGFAGLAALVVLERRRRRLRRPVVLGVCGVLLVLAVLAPPRRSTDVWAYAMYGRMVSEHGVSPYHHAPSEFRSDPAAGRVAPVWRDSRSVYGPGFTALSAAVTAVVGTAELATRLLFQSVAALAVLAALVIVDRRTRDPMAVAFLGANPLTIVSIVNGGHNDAIVGLAVLGAVVLAAARRPLLAGLAAAVGLSVKVTAALPAALVALWLALAQGLGAALVFGGAALVPVGVALIAAGGASALDPVREASARFTRGSVWAAPRRWLSPPGGSAAVDRGLSTLATAAVAALAALLVPARARRPSPAPLVAAGVLAYLLLASYVAPWYVAWCLPVLALEWRSPVAWLATAHAGLLLLTATGVPLPRSSALSPLLGHLYGGVLPVLEVAAVAVLVAFAVLALRRRSARS